MRVVDDYGDVGLGVAIAMIAGLLCWAAIFLVIWLVL
jgi:hypothetical protein